MTPSLSPTQVSRRSFLSGLLASTAAPLLPAVVLAPAPFTETFWWVPCAMYTDLAREALSAVDWSKHAAEIFAEGQIYGGLAK